MSTCDLLIKNGKIDRDGELVEADICITGKTITSIQRSLDDSVGSHNKRTGADSLAWIDRSTRALSRSGTNVQRRFRNWNKGCGCRWTTTVFDMPTTEPVVTNAEIFLEKIRQVQSRAVSNFGLIAAASHDNLASITRISEERGRSHSKHSWSRRQRKERRNTQDLTSLIRGSSTRL